MSMYERLRAEAFPDGVHVLSSIRDARSIRAEIVHIQTLPEWPVTKQAMWLGYLRDQYDDGLLATEEYEDLKNWKLKW